MTTPKDNAAMLRRMDEEGGVENIFFKERVQNHWLHAIEDGVNERPYTALGVAAGIGFILAGGLSPKLAKFALGVGGRAILSKALR